MSRARHKERASGGRLSSEPKWNAGGDQNAAKEAEERKKGGRIQMDEGEKAKKRADRKGRARGGRIGANLAPLSTAARVKHVTKGEQSEDGGPDGKSVPNP